MTVSESLQACFCKQEDIKYVYYGYFFLTMNPYLFHLKLIMNFFVFFFIFDESSQLCEAQELNT